MTALALLSNNPSRLVNLDAAIDAYLGDLARQGRSATTLNAYRRHLHRLASLAPGKDTHELELADYERFLNRWVGAAASTMATGVSLCRGFSRFLEERGLAETDVCRRLRRPRRKRYEDLDVVTVSSVEIARMFAAVRPLAKPGEAGPVVARWQELVCLATALSVGSRRASLARLRRADVDLVHGLVRTLDKGGKVLTKPLPDEYVQLLARADRDGLWQSPDDYLIPNRRPHTVRRKERSDKVVWDTIKLIAERAGVRCHVHALRAAFAVAFDEAHPDEPHTLRDLLGHSRLETTMVYLRRRDKARRMESVRDLSWGLDGFSSQVSDSAPAGAKAHTGFEPVLPEPAVSVRDRRRRELEQGTAAVVAALKQAAERSGA